MWTCHKTANFMVPLNWWYFFQSCKVLSQTYLRSFAPLLFPNYWPHFVVVTWIIFVHETVLTKNGKLEASCSTITWVLEHLDLTCPFYERSRATLHHIFYYILLWNISADFLAAFLVISHGTSVQLPFFSPSRKFKSTMWPDILTYPTRKSTQESPQKYT